LSNLKLAVIGCGAIAKGIHLPVTALSNQVEVTVLVDKFLPRARQLADEYGVPAVADDYQDVIGKVNAAIVALPHYLHAPVTIDLLRHGIHVLVEKPMALKASDCDEMIGAANDTGAVLAVGLVRRFREASRFVRQIIKNGMLGNIVTFDFREGNIYSWSAASALTFQKETGGGVLTGIGPHTLDLLLWWLGDYDSVEYYDDAMGGVEADCELHLQLQCGASGVVELSWTRDLRNSWIIRGERGVLEVEKGFNPLILLKIRNQDVILTGRALRGGTADKSLRDAFCRQLDDFVHAIRNHRQPFVPGQEGKRVVELIEACFASRQSLKQPWRLPEKFGYGVLEGALP
jgi:predicted dehydrogenase